MVPLTETELATVLRTADPETVAGFVAALQAARGRAVERVDGTTVVRERTGERLSVPGEAPAGDADVVVTAGQPVEPDDVEGAVLDAGTLCDQLLYAVDRETADDLLRRWFDRPLSSFEGGTPDPVVTEPPGGTDRPAARAQPPATAATPQTGSNASGGGTAPGGSPRGRSSPGRATEAPATRSDGATAPTRTGHVDRRPGRRAVVLTVAVALVVAAVAGGWATGLLGPGTGQPDAGIDAAGPGGGPNGSWDLPDADRARTGTPGPVTVEGQLPPGVYPSGAVDEQRLAAAHRTLLRNSSFRATITYREFVDGTETAVFIQTVRVENGSRFRVSTTRMGRFEADPPRLLDEDTDAGYGYERVGGVRGSTAPVLEELEQYVRWYLSVEQSRLADARTVDGTGMVLLVTRGDPWPGVENATGSAIVTEAGLVRTLRRSYDEPGSNVRAVVTVRVSDVARRNASDGGSEG